MRGTYQKERFGKALCLLLFFLCFFAAGQKVLAEKKVTVEYYYYNSCDSCTEGEHFEQEFKENISDVIGEEAYTFVLKDVSKDEFYQEFMKLTEGKRTEDFYPQPPLLKIEDNFLFGLDEITERSRDVMIQTVQGQAGPQKVVESMKGIDPSSTFLVYFYMPSCGDCEKVQSYMDGIDKTVYVEGQEESRVKTVYVNIGNLEYVPLANWFYEKYKVPEEDRKAPAIFYQNGYLQGFEDIRDGLPKVLESGQARGWQDITYRETDSGEQKFTLRDWGILLLTGLANGINPCGLSVLLLFLSLILAKKEKILKLGLTFIMAKLVTYLLLGTVFGSVISEVGELVIGPAQKILRMVLAAVFIVLALLSFWDLIQAKQEKYGKMRLQLPGSFKRFHQEYLEKVLNRDTHFLTGLVFVSGIVVSAGEFLCTGQLYLASILYVMGRQGSFQWSVFIKFLVYLVCMCIPLVIITVAADRSAKLFSISEMSRKKIPAAKLIYGILFLAFAVLMFIM